MKSRLVSAKLLSGRLVPALGILLVVFFLAGCDLWNKDMLGYLEHWSETVQLGKVEVGDASVQKNDSGADTISTAATPTIAMYVVNPKAYELVAEIGDSSSADKSVRVSSSAVQAKVHVVAHEPTMLKIQLDSADSSLEHTDFRIDFEAIRQDTMQSSGQVMGVTLRYNTPPVAPIPVVRNEAGEYIQPPAGQMWEAYRDGTLYWAYDDSITNETDPNCAKWFAVNGRRHLVADLKIEDAKMTDDNRSIFGLNVGYGSTSVAAVDSEGVSSPLLSSGQAVPPATYVIKYDANGATGGAAPASQSKTQYTPVTLAANVGNLTRIGYKFSGWNTRADGFGATYSAGATYSDDAGVTLYAQWTYEKPTVGADGKYEVSNHGNLLWIGQELSAGRITKFDLKLTADIVIPSGEWVPINTDGSTFDGQGHSITLTDASSGLFTNCNYATVENLVLKGNITGNSVGGALMKYAYCTVIRNVMSLVTITNTGTGATGGLVGTFGGNDGNGQVTIIENCAVYADISSSGYAGGLVGELWNGKQYGKILNSVYMGWVTGNKAGAVVGYNDSNQSSPSTLQNIYYCVTNNSSIAVIGDTGAGGTVVTNVVSKAEDEIKSEALSILGSSWESGSDGLPRLKKNP